MTIDDKNRIIEALKNTIAQQQKEIENRKKYENLLRSIIRSGESLNREDTFDSFCKKPNKNWVL